MMHASILAAALAAAMALAVAAPALHASGPAPDVGHSTAAQVPAWEVGDFWKYNTTIRTFSQTATLYGQCWQYINVTSEGHYSGNGQSLEVYRQEILGAGQGKVNAGYGALDCAISIQGRTAVEKATLSLVESAMWMNITILGAPFGSNSLAESYSPPEDNYDFPLESGDTWRSNSTHAVDLRTSALGNATYTEACRNNYSCAGNLTLTVPAGEFYALVVNKTSAGSQNSTEWGYSPDVANFVTRNDTAANSTSWTATKLVLTGFGSSTVAEPAVPALAAGLAAALLACWASASLAKCRRARFNGP